MGLTRFPRGVSSFGFPVLGGNYIPPTTGTYFWVDSNYGANGNGDYDTPFSTVPNAVTACTSGAGDVIIMKSGHAESVIAAGTWTFSKTGITVVGLGFGTQKPLITFATATTATILVSGANTTFINFDTTVTIDELVTGFAVQAAHCTIMGVNHRETTAAAQAITWLTTTAAGTYLTVRNCRLNQVTAPAGNGYAITLTGADDHMIVDNYIHWLGTDNAVSGSIGQLTTACLRGYIVGNVCVNNAGTTGVSIKTINSSTGIVSNNRVMNPNAAGSIVLGDSIGGGENYQSAATKGGTLDPVA